MLAEAVASTACCKELFTCLDSLGNLDIDVMLGTGHSDERAVLAFAC